MKDILWIFAFILILGGAVVAYQYIIVPKDHVVEQPVPASRARDIPIIRHPVPAAPVIPGSASLADTGEEIVVEQDIDKKPPAQTEEVPSLPVLDKSDAFILEALDKLVDHEIFRSFFNIDEIIQRFVVTIDNLTRKTMPRKLLTTKRINGFFRVNKETDDLYLHEDNFKRYLPLVRFAESVNVNQLAAVYIRFYPLFQEAYEDLGYPSAYFNDRLIEVIDHLLSTPRVTQAIKILRPRIMYHYADPDLERRSSGQKILIRIGPDNADRIKKRLRKIRELLIQ
jgi:hypothetical protein